MLWSLVQVVLFMVVEHGRVEISQLIPVVAMHVFFAYPFRGCYMCRSVHDVRNEAYQHCTQKCQALRPVPVSVFTISVLRT